MKPLDDLRVIEIDNWMAAPSVGAMLADLGADVIKVEPLEGDPMRNTGRPAKIDEGPRKRYDYQFDVDNRGKRSVAIDLNRDEGIELVHQLCADADVFLCNLLPQRQQRFRLDPDTLHDIAPKLVHATFTGYGTTGPIAEHPGYDVTAFFARSGLYDSMREGPDGPVPMARPAQGDHTAGLALFGAVLAARRLVERGEVRQSVEASLYESAIWTQATDYAITANDYAPVNPRERERQIQATRNRYRCGDGRWVVFNMPNESAWPGFCTTIGAPDILDDERFADLGSRFRNMAALVERIDEALSARGRDEWAPFFDEAGFIWGPVLGLDEVVRDEQAEARNVFPTLHDDEIGEYRTVANPMRLLGVDTTPSSRHPELGADTATVLAEVGISAAALATLATNGVVGIAD